MEAASEPGFWELISTIQDRYGIEVVILLVILLLLAILFYRLIWKVWSSALQSKDDEIERLVKERDKYQRIVFDRLLSSDIDPDDGNS